MYLLNNFTSTTKLKPNKVYRDNDGKHKFKVLAKEGNTTKLLRFGDANMKIKKNIPERRKSFRARHKCDQKNSKLGKRYWSCKMW